MHLYYIHRVCCGLNGAQMGERTGGLAPPDNDPTRGVLYSIMDSLRDLAGGDGFVIASIHIRGELGARPNAFATYGYNPNSCFVVNSSRTRGLQGDVFRLLCTEGCITRYGPYTVLMINIPWSILYTKSVSNSNVYRRIRTFGSLR